MFYAGLVQRLSVALLLSGVIGLVALWAMGS
jgi:hypothetical protein